MTMLKVLMWHNWWINSRAIQEIREPGTRADLGHGGGFSFGYVCLEVSVGHLSGDIQVTTGYKCLKLERDLYCR